MTNLADARRPTPSGDYGRSSMTCSRWRSIVQPWDEEDRQTLEGPSRPRAGQVELRPPPSSAYKANAYAKTSALSPPQACSSDYGGVDVLF
jgi:hypothetical protein